ncbi:MAG: alpha/beta hydrolase, partial [Nitrospirota bacterium]|nr:alpha/beta hydrolase [Nitrospirota bacterium]
PGRAEDDARDLYRAMQLAYEEVKDRIEVSKFHLSGYSLGAWNAAFIAKQDETEQAFDFEKVLLINPPVSLYNSVDILDNMLTDNVPGGINNLHVFFEDFINQIADIYVESDTVNFTAEELLFRLYTETEPGDEELAALIGLAFRLSSTSMLFTSDVMNNFGYIVPKNLQLGTSSSLTPFFQAGTRVSFVQYFNQVYVPYFQSQQPSLTRQDMIDQASLQSIEDYLVGASKIGLSTNEDDIILAPGEIEYLAQIFGPKRAKIFPTGGHMGNLEERAVTAHIVGFFKS